MRENRLVRGALAAAIAAAAVTAGCGGAPTPPRPDQAPANVAPPPAGTAATAPPAAAENAGGPAARTNAIDEHRRREAADPDVPSVTPDELLARYARKEKTYVIEVKGGEGFPAIEGAEVVRPDVLDAWAGRHKKSDYIVAYCT